ncbi:hypothetical protein BKM31_42925 [[Actinomadura] parvosata subsp. kistnae]|uniref:Lipoprotein n=1 Tax=[Actinomadura] parvosata subsp. kistnae TaxID=1909395 RepID=A0A1V0AAT7_9ACTN|nr:hypothetical protein [Nonomuraea sp. ATCC 55076]AQZ67318.1 hypothetical protein BKM31_42925 [Nonomuraea sp. ATCC 55076]
MGNRWPVLVLVVLVVAFSSGCGFLGVAAGGGVCQERADYENALVREALSPVLAQAGLDGAMEDWDDCDSSTYGSHVYVSLDGVQPENVVDAFVKAGWSSRPVAERSRDCAAGCDAYGLTKKVGERVVDVSVEGDEGVEILASAADDCWDAGGYRCVGGLSAG